MSEKHLKVLGAVLVVLVALVALARWNASRPTGSAAPPVDVKKIKDSGIDRIDLSSTEGSVTLTKSSAGWNVGSSTADTATIGTFWKTIEGATFDEIVSTNPANQAQFGVAGPTARRFVFFQGSKKKVELVVGNATDTPGTFYVKVGEGNNVWAVTAPFDTIPTTTGAWRANAPPKKPAKPEK